MIMNAHVNELKSALSLCMDQTAGITAPLPGEIFTHSYKAAAFTVVTTINWICLFLIGMLFPLIVVRSHALPRFLLPFTLFLFLISMALSLSTCSNHHFLFSSSLYFYLSVFIVTFLVGLQDCWTIINFNFPSIISQLFNYGGFLKFLLYVNIYIGKNEWLFNSAEQLEVFEVMDAEDFFPKSIIIIHYLS